MLGPRVPLLRLSALLALTGACATDELSAAQRGQELFNDPRSFSSSPANAFSCATCHDSEPVQGGGIRKPGAQLRGVTARPSYWGGSERDLFTAVSHCVRYFMLGTKPLQTSGEDEEALYAYLESLTPLTAEDTQEIPFTVPISIEDIPRGDALTGRDLYTQACGFCHGAMGTGTARLNAGVPILPGDAIAEHVGYTPRLLRLVFIEKTRHGVFIGYGGSMPPLSLESLSDAELGSILEYLGISGQ